MWLGPRSGFLPSGRLESIRFTGASGAQSSSVRSTINAYASEEDHRSIADGQPAWDTCQQLHPARRDPRGVRQIPGIPAGRVVVGSEQKETARHVEYESSRHV